MEKIQETFNKDLEETKNKQIVMNSTITEINNTVEGIKRITEAEEQISELEDRMVEIAVRQQNKGKRMKRIEDSLRHLDNINATTFELQGSQGKKRKRKSLRKFLRQLQLKTSPAWERKYSIQGAQ